MSESAITIPKLLDELESFYGPQQPTWPTDPYLFLVWWHCGYPASDHTCEKGWGSLTKSVGVTPEKLLAASHEALTSALKTGGMVPELRALRLKEIAMRVKDQLGGDLLTALSGPLIKHEESSENSPTSPAPVQTASSSSPISHPSQRSHPTVLRYSCVSSWEESAKLRRDLQRSPASNRVADTGYLRPPYPRISSAQTSRPDHLQTHQPKVRPMPRQRTVRLLLRQTSRTPGHNLTTAHTLEAVASSA